MERENPAICADCGRTIEHGVAPDLSGRCERCAERASIPPGDPGGNPHDTPDQPWEPPPGTVIDRLRRSYHEARALVGTDASEPTHRGQLDWIFGVQGDDARRQSTLDARTSELVVLWLEDLIRHLEALAETGGASLAGEQNLPATRSQSAARGLHAATREFADAFRRAADPECRP